jgi:Uri superfamily endonuclease
MTAPGTYLLHIRLPKKTKIHVGRLGDISLPSGSFAYIGSALGPGGLQGRIGRHLRSDSEKRRHWHIDWLTSAGDIIDIWWVAMSNRLECAWSTALGGIGTRPIKGFGSSDCSCPSHLIYMETAEAVSRAWKVLNRSVQAKLKCQRIDELSSSDIESMLGEII